MELERKTAEIIKDHFLVLKKPNVHSVWVQEDNFRVIVDSFVFVSSSLFSCHKKVTEALCI